MTSENINKTLKAAHPAAWRCLSPLGKRLFFPMGVPAQAAEAKGCAFNATIGQLTDGHGAALPLPTMAACISNLSPEEVFLYTSQGGRADLRDVWQRRILDEASVPISRPVACAGLTHGLSIVADLFVDEDTTVLLPGPRWGNYDLIFGTKANGRIVTYPSMSGPQGDHSAWRFNIEGLASAIDQVNGKSVLLLNMPSNPSGYSPTLEEVQQIVSVVQKARGPMVVVLDEAYKGMEWEEGILKGSMIESLKHLDPERFLTIKIDGATKELFFFGGRIGFVTYLTNPSAAAVLEEKTIGGIRATVSALSSPAQAMVLAALTSPTFDDEVAVIRNTLQERYKVLDAALLSSSLDPWPFNSAFFAMIHTPDGAESTRRRLLDVGVGSVAVNSVHSIRISYSTVPATDIPEMVRRIERVVHPS